MFYSFFILILQLDKKDGTTNNLLFFVVRLFVLMKSWQKAVHNNFIFQSAMYVYSSNVFCYLQNKPKLSKRHTALRSDTWSDSSVTPLGFTQTEFFLIT